VERWSKPDTTAEIRMEDWIACGGRKNGGFGFDTRSQMLSGEDYGTARNRLEVTFQRCLIRKGYRYEWCDQELLKNKPICSTP
jgi:hypothetical protein